MIWVLNMLSFRCVVDRIYQKWSDLIVLTTCIPHALTTLWLWYVLHWELGSGAPFPEPGWTFVTAVTHRIWWNSCSMTSQAIAQNTLHFSLSLGMLALRTQLPYCEEVQMGTPWTNPACYPAALLRAQPTGTPTTTHASEGVSRWFQVYTIKWTTLPSQVRPLTDCTADQSSLSSPLLDPDPQNRWAK